MANDVPQPLIDAARAYEALFVPALFGPWAPVVADAAAIGPGDHVLDVACGTGVVSREAAARVGSAGSVTGLDLGPGMLAVAGELAPDVTFRQGDATSLPFDDGTFDAVVSQFGLMFFPDRVRALEEMWRVLRPGGRLAVAVWDVLEENGTYVQSVALLDREAGPAAADALRAPYVLGNAAELHGLAKDAGIRDPEMDTHRGTATFPAISTMVEADLRGWLPLMGVALAEDVIQRVLDAAEQDLARYLDPEGRVVFATSALVLSAAKP